MHGLSCGPPLSGAALLAPAVRSLPWTRRLPQREIRPTVGGGTGERIYAKTHTSPWNPVSAETAHEGQIELSWIRSH
eukprot:scaffold785_cov286-Prasinococcus_capsulatus_cf.AAC.1